MIGLSFYLARGPKSDRDYYLGGNKTAPLPIALSTMATQCSTNSLLGAPAFVAFAAGGGLIWLQFELALPLAMIALMAVIFPLLRGMHLVVPFGAIMAAIIMALHLVGGLSIVVDQPARLRAVNFSSHGFGDGQTFAFWPMLIGGFFSAYAMGYLISLAFAKPDPDKLKGTLFQRLPGRTQDRQERWGRYYVLLALYAAGILALLVFLTFGYK